MSKFNFIFDNTIKAKKLKKKILKNYKNYPPKNAEVIVVSGGDGFMLKTMKKFNKFKKPFYGINCGSVGFLMNKYIIKKIEYKIKKAKIIQINPLQITTRSRENKRYTFMAIN